MGRMQAEGMANIAPLRVGLEWHLQCNHYPPVPLSMVDTCIAAIEAAEEGDWDREIFLPDPVEYKGQPVAPAYAIIGTFHLDAWIDREGDDY